MAKAAKKKAKPRQRVSAAAAKRTKFAQAIWQGMGQREAARAAGYKGSDRNLDAYASKMAKHGDVQTELARLREMARGETVRVAEKGDVLGVLTAQAIGGIGRYLRFDDEGKFTGVDLARIQQDGAMHLLHGLEFDAETGQPRRFKFASSQGAIDRLAKLLGWNAPKKHEVRHSDKDLKELSDAELHAYAKKLGVKVG